jgi:hypothetical protein
MIAYEFSTVVQDGIIHVPKQLSDKKLLNVRVILLTELAKDSTKPHKNNFTAMRLKTKDFTFNREELHER